MGLEERTGIQGTYWGNTYNSSNALNQAQMEINANYIWKYLKAQGWTKNAVAGILGNMQSESSINPRKVAIRYCATCRSNICRIWISSMDTLYEIYKLGKW